MVDLSKGRPGNEVMALDYLFKRREYLKMKIKNLEREIRVYDMMIKHYQRLAEEK